MTARIDLIEQLADKADILRAQIEGVRKIAREAGADVDAATRPYVDMLANLLTKELLDTLRPRRSKPHK